MLNHQQPLLTLIILFMISNDVQAGKNKFVMSKGHPAPEYASGPNGTMNEADYINQFRSICDDLKVQNEANNAIHAQFKDLFKNMVVSSQPTNGSMDCTLSRIFRDTNMFTVFRNKSFSLEDLEEQFKVRERAREVKHCLVNERDTELLKKFVALYKAEYMLNSRVQSELDTAFGTGGQYMFKPVNKTYFNTSDPFTIKQHGCWIDNLKNNWMNVSIRGLQEIKLFNRTPSDAFKARASFTKEKKESFKDIQFYINKTFDALSDLIDYANANQTDDALVDQSKISKGAKFHDESGKKKPRLAKMEMLSENPLPFNPLLILLGSITTLVIVAATMALVICLKKSKKNESFRRLKEEDPEANETNPTNPANAVKWSLENDQLTLFSE